MALPFSLKRILFNPFLVKPHKSICSWVLPVSRFHMVILFKTVINTNYPQNFFAYAEKPVNWAKPGSRWGCRKRGMADGWIGPEGELMTAKKGNSSRFPEPQRHHEEAFLWGKHPISS